MDKFEALDAALGGNTAPPQNAPVSAFNALDGALRNLDSDTGQAALATPESPQPTVEGIPLPPQGLYPDSSPIGLMANQFRQARRDRPTEVEFPDAGEITDIPGLDFGESFRATLATGTTTDPTDKARILAQQFAGDERFGGIFQDRFGNPMIQWNGEPFYMNVPGLSGTDLNDFIANVTAFLPASRLAGAGASVLTRGATALPAYAGTDLLMQGASQQLGAEGPIDVEQTGYIAGGGAVAESLLPPILRGASRAARNVFGTAPRSSALAYAPRSNGTPTPPYRNGQIPLTSGQASGDLAQINAEEAMRSGGRGDVAQNMFRTFDDRQQQIIGDVADSIESQMGAGVGVGPQAATDIGARLQDDLISARNTAHTQASQAMTNAASQRGAASFTPDSFREAVGNIRGILRERHFDIGAPGMEGVRRIVQQAENFANIPGLRSVNLEAFEVLRGRVNNLIQNNGSAQDVALNAIRGQLDGWLDDAVATGLVQGDETVISQLREARGLWRHYQQTFRSQGQGDVVGKLMERLVDPNQTTPVNLVSALVSLSRAGRQSTARGLIQRLGDVFGRDSQQFQFVRSAYLTEAFTRAMQGAREVSASTINTNLRYLLDGDGAVIARELWGDGGLNLLRAFRDDVARTITPEAARNPSRSGWAILRELTNRGILPAEGGATGMLVGFLRNRSGAIAATDAIAGLSNTVNTPLIGAGTASFGQQAYQNPDQLEAFLAPLRRSTAPVVGLLSGPQDTQQPRGLLAQ